MFARSTYNLPTKFFREIFNARENENFAHHSTRNCLEIFSRKLGRAHCNLPLTGLLGGMFSFAAAAVLDGVAG
jgi:hypothetical protein